MWSEVGLHVSVIEHGDLCHGDDHHTLSFFVIVGTVVVIIVCGMLSQRVVSYLNSESTEQLPES